MFDQHKNNADMLEVWIVLEGDQHLVYGISLQTSAEVFSLLVKPENRANDILFSIEELIIYSEKLLSSVHLDGTKKTLTEDDKNKALTYALAEFLWKFISQDIHTLGRTTMIRIKIDRRVWLDIYQWVIAILEKWSMIDTWKINPQTWYITLTIE